MWKIAKLKRHYEAVDRTEESIREDFCLQMKQHLLYGLNIFVHQDLFTNILKKVLNSKYEGVIDLSVENIGADYIKLESAWDLLEDILAIFGREGLSNLDLSHFNIKSGKILGINHVPIEVMGEICNNAIHNTLFKNIGWAESLTSINLQNAVDSRTVYCIGMFCRNLQYLNLLTDNLMEGEIGDFVSNLSYLYGELASDWIQTTQPTGCSNLQYLILPILKRKVDLTEHLIKMLFFMSNLRAVRNAPMRSAIEKYISKAPHVEPLKLFEFEDEKNEYFLGAAQIENNSNLINNVKICHIIQDVKRYKFSVTNESENFNIKEIQQLTNICKLEMELDVLDILWFPIFPSITDLTVKYEEAMDMGDILQISFKFPNIQHLCITASDLYSSLENDRKEIIFHHLTSLKFCMLELDRSLLIQMLMGCPKLTSLKIYVNGKYSSEFEPLTDEDISMIVPYLLNMEVIEFSRDPFNPLINEDVEQLPLTMASAELLLQSCPKLRWLGSLETWTISDEDFRNLVTQIKKANFDLHLSYSQCSPWQILYPHYMDCPHWLRYGNIHTA